MARRAGARPRRGRRPGARERAGASGAAARRRRRGGRCGRHRTPRRAAGPGPAAPRAAERPRAAAARRPREAPSRAPLDSLAWRRPCRTAGTRIPRSCGASRSGSSAPRGSTSGTRDSSRNPATSRRRSAGRPSSSRATATASLRGFVNVCRHRGFTVAEGRAEPRDAPVPVPRLDVRPRRPPPRCAAQRGGAGLPAGRARPRAGRGRHLGPVRLRERRPRAGAARAGARLAARAGRGARARRRLARPPLALGGRDRGELEDRLRELPRVLPLPGRASRLQRADRRLARGVRALDGRAPLDPARPAADGDARRTCCRARSSTSSGRTSRSTSSPAGRTSRSGRPCRGRPTARTASSTTSSARTSSRPGSTTSSRFDDQVGREDAKLVEGVQRGVASGALEHGVLMSHSEQLIAHFQALYRAEPALALGRVVPLAGFDT